MGMIQPINAFSPRAGFRGSKETYGKRAPKSANSKIALINAGGVALAAGGITTAVARSYTHSWGHAGVLGVGGAFLAMFFMTPHLIDKKTFGKIGKKAESDVLVKEDAQKMTDVVKEHLKPAKKLVQFRQQSNS